MQVKIKFFKLTFLKKFWIIFITFSCEFLILINLQENLALAKSSSEGQTKIRSDIIDIKRKSQTVSFINNVVVEKDDSSLLAKKMVLFYNEDRKPRDKNSKLEEIKNEKIEKPKISIKRIEARENVKIFSEEFVASGDFGYFDPQKNIFVLQQNVIVNNGTSIASGDKFIYNLTTKKGNFVGNKDKSSIKKNDGDKRVVVVIGEDLQDKKTEEKNKK
jgi:lipopolysaccharide export system protein LptA